jgi:trk system potassium uptake protein TrkA
VHALRRGRAEAIEAVAHSEAGRSRVVGRQISDIKLPPGTSISAIVRGDDVIEMHHDTVVEENDHVILFVTDRRHVDDVERLFQAKN